MIPLPITAGTRRPWPWLWLWLRLQRLLRSSKTDDKLSEMQFLKLKYMRSLLQPRQPAACWGGTQRAKLEIGKCASRRPYGVGDLYLH